MLLTDPGEGPPAFLLSHGLLLLSSAPTSLPLGRRASGPRFSPVPALPCWRSLSIVREGPGPSDEAAGSPAPPATVDAAAANSSARSDCSLESPSGWSARGSFEPLRAFSTAFSLRLVMSLWLGMDA
eukprot:1016327-Pyramimonas_sp.AAC.1